MIAIRKSLIFNQKALRQNLKKEKNINKKREQHYQLNIKIMEQVYILQIKIAHQVKIKIEHQILFLQLPWKI